MKDKNHSLFFDQIFKTYRKYHSKAMNLLSRFNEYQHLISWENHRFFPKSDSAFSRLSLSFHFPQDTPFCHTPVLTPLSHRLIFLYYFTEKFLKTLYFQFLPPLPLISSLIYENLVSIHWTPIQFQTLINPRLVFRLHITWTL